MSSPAHRMHRHPHQVAPGAGGAVLSALPRRPHPADPGARPSQGEAPEAAAVRIGCSGEGFARARGFTRDTLHRWSLDHLSDDVALVLTELAANAVSHAVPRTSPSGPEVWLGLLLDSTHVTLTVSDHGDNAPEFTATDGSALREHGRGLCIVDALADEWGWTLQPPFGKTVWARLSTRPPT